MALIIFVYEIIDRRVLRMGGVWAGVELYYQYDHYQNLMVATSLGKGSYFRKDVSVCCSVSSKNFSFFLKRMLQTE